MVVELSVGLLNMIKAVSSEPNKNQLSMSHLLVIHQSEYVVALAFLSGHNTPFIHNHLYSERHWPAKMIESSNCYFEIYIKFELFKDV